jgi:ketosteroid isomerase-like protein
MRPTALTHSVLLSLLLLGPAALAAQNLPGGNPRDYAERQRRAAEEYRREMLLEVTGTFGRWKNAWAEDDAGDAADFYTEDAVIVVPTQNAAYRGKADVEQFLEGLLPMVGALSTDIIEFDAGDRLAYLVVHFSSPPSHGIDGSGGMQGTFVSVFRLEGRNWKIRSQTFFEQG